MNKKIDAQIALLEAILAELRRLNTNLERRADSHELKPGQITNDQSEDMQEFE